MGPKSTDDSKDEPSLELPSLSLPGLRRRRKAKKQAAPEPVTAPAARQPEDTRPTQDLAPASPPTDQPEPPRDKQRRSFALPALPGRVAAAVTGVVVGVLGTGLTYLALAGCELAKGTSTCGGGPGLFLLVAIVIVMILAGAALLKAWQVGDPASTSFLAVAVVAVVALLLLIDVLFSGWMFLVVPMVSAAAYSLSHWVTTRFVDDERSGGGLDVR